MFLSARLKLTAYYLLIIMVISVLFSVVIYRLLDREFQRFRRVAIFRQEHILPQPPPLPNIRISEPRIVMLNPEAIAEAEDRLRAVLVGINLGIMLIAGGAGYFLAGRTLRPIKEMVDEQNRFITDASHELRTPLTSLKSEIEVYLRDKKLTLGQAKKLLASNLEEVNSLQLLSDNLIKLTQYQKHQKKQVFEPVFLKEIIDGAVKKVAPQAKQKEIAIATNVKDEIIEGNKQDLVELLVILLDNAIKYSKAHTSITIGAHKIDHSVAVTITDQGVGIDAKDIPHLFDRFYRADTARTKGDVGGYGLGLSIAKKIVDLHNGSMKVASKVGEGTTFTIILPTKQLLPTT